MCKLEILLLAEITILVCTFRERMNFMKMGMDVQGMDVQIGDIVAGRNYDTGLYMQKPVVKKIVKVENGTITIEHKVEGEN